MSISKMTAAKMNLDLRELVLDILEGIYLLKKRDVNNKKEGQAYLKRAKNELSEISSRHEMLDSLSYFYNFEINVVDNLRELMDKVNKKEYRDVESKLSDILLRLEDSFSEDFREGLLREHIPQSY